MKWYDAKGDPASRLRQRKYALLRRLQIPPDALPGSLALTHHRCGKPTCRCADGEGHPAWSLTFMVDGTKPFAGSCAAPPCPSGSTVPVANSTNLKSTSAMSLACPIY